MIDEGTLLAPAEAAAMSPADEAVSYMLARIQVDADLRWLMLHTEAFAKLCQAEGHRTGETPEMVGSRRSIDLRPKYRRRDPRLPLALKHLEAIVNAARLVLDRFGPVELATAGEGLRELRDSLDAMEREGGMP